MKKEFYHDIDLKANQLFNSRLQNITTASRTTLGASLSTADKGYVVYDTDLLSLFLWDGTQWDQTGTGSGTLNYIPKWTSSGTALGNSQIFDNGSGVMVNTTTYDYYKLDVNGSARVMTNLVVGPVYPGSILIDTSYGIRVNTPISGAVNGFGVLADGEIQPDVTNNVYYFRSFTKTKATPFTVGTVHHFTATQATLGAGSVINTQYGFNVVSNMTGATTNNIGFIGQLPADGTKNWNLWMSGTAPNYIAGGLQIGPNTLGNQSLRIGRAIDAATYVVTSDGAISSGAAAGVTNYVSGLRTTGTFTLSSFTHYLAIEPATPTTTTSQICFWANNTIISGTNNFGFRGSLPSNTNNWNLYMEGAAKNYLAGNTLIGTTTDAGFKLDVSGTFRTSGQNTLTNLAGSGTRMVVASSTGVLSTQTIPTGTGTVTAVTASTPLASSGGTAPNITIQQSSSSQDGFLSSTDWTTFNNKQSAISLTTTGTSGAATFIANTLNIPQYQAAGTYVTSVGATGPITSSGGTTPTISTSMATNRLIGRSTAGVGVMEEITVGTGLSLSGGTLSATGGGGGIPKGTASGTDTYTTTIAGVSSYVDGDAYLIRFTNGNTTGATLNINSLGAKTLFRNNDGNIIGGDIEDGSEMLCVFNSTLDGFQVIGTSPNSLIAYVTNDDSVTITKGQVVYAFSGTGDRMTVKLANNTGDATSAQTVGLVMSASIAPNQKGFIMMQGLLDGLSILPTATWSDGDTVYLGATAGSITPTKPYAPNHLVYLGVVTTASNGTSGRMYVKVQNGYEMNEIHDVQSNGAVNKDVLYRDTTVSPNLWKPASITTILGYTPLQRSINVVSTTTSAGSVAGTDYIYLVSGTTTITLPTPVGNTNQYTIKRVGTNTVSIATTSGTIDGSASPITINVQYASLTLVSDGTNWNII